MKAKQKTFGYLEEDHVTLKGDAVPFCEMGIICGGTVVGGSLGCIIGGVSGYAVEGALLTDGDGCVAGSMLGTATGSNGGLVTGIMCHLHDRQYHMIPNQTKKQ